MHFFNARKNGGLYNLGTGQCRTFLDLAKAVFAAFNKPEHIDFVDMPADIRDRYQYHTEANMDRLVAAGYVIPFTPLELAVEDYVNHYLVGHTFL
jgi:ADP-L-glycero-D-manno-heptose 6-epimerase